MIHQSPQHLSPQYSTNLGEPRSVPTCYFTRKSRELLSKSLLCPTAWQNLWRRKARYHLFSVPGFSTQPPTLFKFFYAWSCMFLFLLFMIFTFVCVCVYVCVCLFTFPSCLTRRSWQNGKLGSALSTKLTSRCFYLSTGKRMAAALEC